MTSSSQYTISRNMQKSAQNVDNLDAETLKLLEYHQMLRNHDPKDLFIQSLISQILELKQQKSAFSDRETLTEALEISQREVQRLESVMAQDPYVLVLINGNDTIFHEDLLRNGEEGGDRAAQYLYDGATAQLRDEMPDLPPGTQFVCRAYTCVKGLADMLLGADGSKDPDVLNDFMRGFTRSSHLFDFIDVGPGEGRADHKIGEILRLHLRSPQCRRVLLGISHDKAVAPFLSEPSHEAYLREKVTLIEGLSFDEQLVAYKLKTVRLGNLFRSEKLVAPVANPRHDTPQSVETLTRSTTSMSFVDRAATPGATSSASSAPLTWAGRAALPAPPMAPLPPPITQSPPKSRPASTTGRITESNDSITRNRKGQRMDPPAVEFDKDEVNRIKKMKLCNVHYLLDRCWRDKCEHEHKFKPSKRELQVLKLVARMTPCTNGPACDDESCIYGHRCPFPTRTEKNNKWVKGGKDDAGGKSCIFGHTCKFPAEVHDVDNMAYKVKKV